MAHMVYKKPLQNQKIRDQYLELRQAKNAGRIDAEAYDEAKRTLLSHPQPFDKMTISPSTVSIVDSDSRMSGSASSSGSSIQSPAHPETRKGSIFDRNNVARLVYRTDSQSEEVRRARREAEKAQAQAERFAALNGHQDSSAYNPGPYGMSGVSSLPLPIRTSTSQTTTTSDSKSTKSSTQRINFNIFRKRSRVSPPASPLFDVPPVPRLPKEALSTRSMRPSQASDTSIFKEPMMRRHTESLQRGGGDIDNVPMTFADLLLVGPPRKPKSQASSRRHSFSSQNPRPSFTSSRLSVEAPELGARKPREEYVYESRPNSSEAGQLRILAPFFEASQPRTLPNFSEASEPRTYSLPEPLSPTCLTQRGLLSSVLQDIFLSLLNDFSNTSILFSYPKSGKVRSSSLTSSFRSVTRSGRVDEEDEIGRAIGGGASFFIDESTVTLRSILEKRVWFLMAMKWLSFGRVLFSPGHYIIELNKDVSTGLKRPDVKILDLDGAVTADWSWHLADEYPFATVYNVLLPRSPRPPRNSISPPNLHFITTTSLSTLAALQPNSIDVITSHNLPRLLFRDKNQSQEELHTLITRILLECARVLKPSGYFEITVVDPIMNNMGPLTRDWIMKHVTPQNNMRPSKVVLAALEQLSGRKAGALFSEVKECWVWMPTTSIGDELSTVTSLVGRHLYDELFAPEGETDEEKQRIEKAYGVFGKKECSIWKDEKVIEECQKENTAFRWLKCYARKA